MNGQVGPLGFWLIAAHVLCFIKTLPLCAHENAHAARVFKRSIGRAQFVSRGAQPAINRLLLLIAEWAP